MEKFQVYCDGFLYNWSTNWQQTIGSSRQQDTQLQNSEDDKQDLTMDKNVFLYFRSFVSVPYIGGILFTILETSWDSPGPFGPPFTFPENHVYFLKIEK